VDASHLDDSAARDVSAEDADFEADHDSMDDADADAVVFDADTLDAEPGLDPDSAGGDAPDAEVDGAPDAALIFTFEGPATFAPSLTHHDLHINAISGTIPEELGELVRLGVLNLGTNGLDGVTGDPFSSMPALHFLRLIDNLLLTPAVDAIVSQIHASRASFTYAGSDGVPQLLIVAGLVISLTGK